jgi:hypothetical protein
LSISDSSSESSDSLDPSSEESNESEDSEQQQFRREMDAYDEMVARAYEIVETDCQRCQELDSDSDLSVLASSLFSRIEGIKKGSSTVTRQDDRGNGEMQGLVFSPRKTRSGRILQRIE